MSTGKANYFPELAFPLYWALKDKNDSDLLVLVRQQISKSPGIPAPRTFLSSLSFSLSFLSQCWRVKAISTLSMGSWQLTRHAGLKLLGRPSTIGDPLTHQKLLRLWGQQIWPSSSWWEQKHPKQWVPDTDPPNNLVKGDEKSIFCNIVCMRRCWWGRITRGSTIVSTPHSTGIHWSALPGTTHPGHVAQLYVLEVNSDLS